MSHPSETLPKDDVAAIDELRLTYARLNEELGKIIVGQQQVIEQLAICLFARGHALLMGVPGLAKTLLISRLAETMSLSFSRIQFTPDLMPMDITGTDILQELPGGKRAFEFARGRFSRTSCSLMRSTVRLRRRRRPCSRRCRSIG
jgi:MoxR-like ATPase